MLFFCVLFFCVEGLLYSVGMYAVKLTAVLAGQMGWVFYCKCVAFTRPPKIQAPPIVAEMGWIVKKKVMGDGDLLGNLVKLCGGGMG